MNAYPFSACPIFNKLFCFTIIVLLISCGPVSNDNADQIILPEESQEIVPILEPEVSYSMEAPSDAIPSETSKDLKVILSVDSVMYLGQSGMMEVWIGEEDIDVSFSKGMTQDEKKISSTSGRYAKITPYAPDFDVKSISATICYKIDPSGTEVRYSLIPKDEGEYKVSADIELFQTETCTGVSIPKTARAMSVTVGVNMKKEISKGIHKMEKVAWDKFMIFWAALITLLFGVCIYLVRRYIKNKTGYVEGPGTVQ